MDEIRLKKQNREKMRQILLCKNCGRKFTIYNHKLMDCCEIGFEEYYLNNPMW